MHILKTYAQTRRKLGSCGKKMASSLILMEDDVVNKTINIIMIVECIISIVLYLFVIFTFHNQLALVRLLISILFLLIGNGIILVFLTNLIKFDLNKIYGFKFELFILGFVFQIAAFAFLKHKIG